MTDYDPTSHAATLIGALMRSVPDGAISPRDWWPRATSALITAAASADRFPTLVSTACRKLGIEVLDAQASAAITKLYGEIPDFEAFRRFCERDATWAVAVHRASKPVKAKPATKPAPTPTPTATIDDEEPLF